MLDMAVWMPEFLQALKETFENRSTFEKRRKGRLFCHVRNTVCLVAEMDC